MDEYLGIGGAKHAHFKKAWFGKDTDKLCWKPKLRSSINEGNTPLIALTELSKDFSESNGFLRSISALRIASTHRFVVLHELGGESRVRDAKSVEHHAQDEFVGNLISTLKVVRSSLLYFVEMVAINENIKTRDKDGYIGQLDVPSHHYIRGEDEE